MAEINSFYKSKYTGEQLDRALDNIYDSVLVDGSKPMTGALTIKKADNGHARFDKDHTATADAGTVVEDIDKNGNTAAILLRGADKSARLKFGATNYEMLHSGNIQPYIAPYAQSAEQAAEAAESALEGVREAIENIPEGTATPIVNDLTTGGASMALSAEMGKRLLPLDGSKTMTGALKSPNGIVVNKLRLEDWGSGEAVIRFYDRNGNGNRYISMWDKTKTNSLKAALLFVEEINGVYTTNQILHTGNKPSGSYTGNGSATARTIDVGGIGQAMLIRSNEYGNVIASLYSSKLGENPKNFTSLEVSYSDGKLHLATNHDAVNRSGVTYYYQVL